MAEPADDEISLLDLLVVIAENWILLLLVPLAIAAVTYGVLVAQPQTLRSQATLAIPPTTVEAFVSEALDEGTYSTAMARAEEGEDGLIVSQGSEPQTSVLQLTSDNRELHSEFRVLVDDMIALVETGIAAEQDDDRSEWMFEREQRLELRDQIIARLETAVGNLAIDGVFDAEAYSAAVMALDRMLERRDAEADELERREAETAERADDREIVIAPVSGPDRLGRSPLLVAIFALLASGFFLLIFVFAKAGVRQAMQNAESREKMNRIKNAFLLRRQPR